MEARTVTTAAEGHLGMGLSAGERLRSIIAEFEAATAVDVLPRSGVTTTSTTVTTTVARTALTAAPETVTLETRPALAEAVDGRDHHGPDQVLVAGKAAAEVWLPGSNRTELPILAQARLAVGLPSLSAERKKEAISMYYL